MTDSEIFQKLERQFASLTEMNSTLKIAKIRYTNLEEKIIMLEDNILETQEQLVSIMNFFAAKKRKTSSEVANQVQKFKRMRP